MIDNQKTWAASTNLVPIRPSMLRQGTYLAFAAGALVFMSVSTGPALADISVLNRGIDRAQAELAPQPGIQFVQSQQNNRAREQAIIGRLEEEIRRLNGRIEELEFEQRQTNNRLDQLADRLEQGAVPFDTGQPGNSQPALLDQTARSPEEALKELADQAEDGSLGRVPESAVAGLPRPNPAEIKTPEKANFSAEKQYENAVQLLRAGDYQGAQNGLELFLDVNEGHQLASNAAYWLAETHYVRQNYTASAAAFARNYGNYGKDAPKAIDNLLKLGMSLSNLGQMEQACLTYEELAGTFPSTPAHIQQAVNRERARAKCA